MGAWKQKRRDPLTLEERRKGGISMLLGQGNGGRRLSQADVARKLGVTRGAVSQWWDAYLAAEKSMKGLKARKHTGRPPQMNSGQKRALARMLLKGAEYHGFETDIWTTERVAELIKDKFGIEYHPDHVRKILIKSLGFSWHKPQKVARERDEKVVRRWIKNTLSEVKKS